MVMYGHLPPRNQAQQRGLTTWKSSKEVYQPSTTEMLVGQNGQFTGISGGQGASNNGPSEYPGSR